MNRNRWDQPLPWSDAAGCKLRTLRQAVPDLSIARFASLARRSATGITLPVKRRLSAKMYGHYERNICQPPPYRIPQFLDVLYAKRNDTRPHWLDFFLCLNPAALEDQTFVERFAELLAQRSIVNSGASEAETEWHPDPRRTDESVDSTHSDGPERGERLDTWSAGGAEFRVNYPPGHRLEQVGYTDVMNWMVTTAPQGEVLYGSLRGGSFAHSWVRRRFRNFSDQTSPPRVSRLVLKRLSPKAVAAAVAAGTLPPEHEESLSLQIRGIESYLSRLGIPCEIRYWQMCPAPFHGWMYGTHLLRAEWMLDWPTGLWTVSNPLACWTRSDNPELFKRTLADFGSD